MIDDTDAIKDEASGRWGSRAEVAEIDRTAFLRPQELRAGHGSPPHPGPESMASHGQVSLFESWRSTPSFTPPAAPVRASTTPSWKGRADRQIPHAHTGHASELS